MHQYEQGVITTRGGQELGVGGEAPMDMGFGGLGDGGHLSMDLFSGGAAADMDSLLTTGDVDVSTGEFRPVLHLIDRRHCTKQKLCVI